MLDGLWIRQRAERIGCQGRVRTYHIRAQNTAFYQLNYLAMVDETGIEPVASRLSVALYHLSYSSFGALGWGRTTAARIFNPPLYR